LFDDAETLSSGGRFGINGSDILFPSEKKSPFYILTKLFIDPLYLCLFKKVFCSLALKEACLLLA